MNHNVGEVSYDIRFARQKASQDIAAIEAEWNAALARMNSKGVGLSGSGAGAPAAASGGYAGQSAPNGQPMQGAPPAPQRLRARDPSLQAIVDAQLAAGNARMRSMTGDDVALPVAPNGQPAPQARGGARIVGTSNGDVSLRQRMPALQGASTGTAAGPTTTTAAVAWLKPVLIGAAINAIASELASEATYSKNLTLAGTNNTMRAQTMVQRRKDLFGAVPLIGGSLGTIATASDEAYLQKTQNTQDVGEHFGAVGSTIAGNRMRGRAAGVLDSYGRGILESKAAQTVTEDSIRRDRAAYFEKNVKPTLKSENAEDYGRNLIYKDREMFKRFAAEAAVENKGVSDQYNSQTGALINSLPYSRERVAMTRQFDISLAQQGVELKERNLNNAMRPGEAAAAGALGRFAIDKEYTQGSLATIDGSTQEGKDLRGRLRSGLAMRGSLEKAGLESQRMDALKNIFGGRPTEIDGMQSVEAMRDISPETNEGKLGALNDAIEKLTIAINNMQKGVP